MNYHSRLTTDASERWTAGGLTKLPVLRIQKLAVAGVLQLPGFPPALALCAGRGDEEPVGEGDRGEQRQDAFEQLPTGTHECQTAPSEVYLESAPDAPQWFFDLRFSPAGRRRAAFHCEATASRRRGGILGAIHGLGKPAREVARWETSDRGDASVGLDAGFLDHFRPARFLVDDERAERFRRAGAHLGALFRQELLHVAGIQDPGQLGVEFRY